MSRSGLRGGDDTSGLGSDLTYTVTGDTNPSLFSSVAIDPSTGQLTLAYAPQAVGSSQLTVRATDSTGDYAEAPFSVTVIDPGTPLYWTPQNNSTSVGSQLAQLEYYVRWERSTMWVGSGLTLRFSIKAAEAP